MSCPISALAGRVEDLEGLAERVEEVEGLLERVAERLAGRVLELERQTDLPDPPASR